MWRASCVSSCGASFKALGVVFVLDVLLLRRAGPYLASCIDLFVWGSGCGGGVAASS